MASICIVAERYCAPFPVELTVSKKAMSASGEGFHITDAEGRVVFKMDGHALSIRDRCTLLDHDGHAILTARKKLVSMHERWEACRGENFSDENVLFSVRKTSVMQFKTHLKVFLRGNEDDDAPDFEMKGNFMEREGQIFHGDQVVAELKRKFGVGNVVMDKHTFITWVCPHMDQAFIATLVIIMDRIHND